MLVKTSKTKRIQQLRAHTIFFRCNFTSQVHMMVKSSKKKKMKDKIDHKYSRTIDQKAVVS